MFSGKPRPRPVPSAAALKVLYQLAYISSGTAVGVGVLCAEERRRRTQVVQKIADNAKRIRQSPRYYHSATLAVSDVEDQYIGSHDSDWAPERQSGAATSPRKSSRRHLKSHDAVKGPELPSVVEQGYAHQLVDDEKRHGQSNDRRDMPAQHASRNTNGIYGVGSRPSPSGTEQQTRTSDMHPRLHRISPLHPFPSTTSSEVSKYNAGWRSLDSARTPYNDLDYELLAEMIRGFCAAGELKRAVDLLYSSRDDGAGRAVYLSLVREVFDAALAGVRLSLCIEILQLEKSRQEKRVFIEHCEAFLKACDDQQAYDTISSLFVPRCQLGKACLDGLSGAAHEIIALACTKHITITSALMKRFKDSYRRVPESLRGRVIQSRTCLRLKAIWQSTHDYAKVQAELGGMSSWLQELKDHEALRRLTMTALEIQVSANRADDALNTLSRIHQVDGANGETITLAAVLFAKQGAWDSVDRLMTLAQAPGSMVFDPSITTKFNNLIHLFARHHSSVSTWKFVTAAVDKLGFIPNQATTEIVLQCFVTRRTVNLIPRWLRYLKIMGYRFQLDARVAAKLLKRYYLDCRPSHVLMMWFSRNLIHFAPSLATGTHFVNLVTEAIGYDLRHLTPDRSRPIREDHAMTRLDLVEQTTSVVASPGNRWHDELVLPDFHTESESPAKPREAVERKMTLALSLHQYTKVLDLYESSLDAVDIPSSPLALEVAVEASLRLHQGNRSEAEELMAKAKEAGLNITCAMGPLLIHQMQNISSLDRSDANKLRLAVLDYYRIREENGWPTKHHVGVTAANVLISHGNPHHGINILDAIYRSHSATALPLDTAAMTVFLKGYSALRHKDGIRWIVRTILDDDNDNDLRIDQKFLWTLKQARRRFRAHDDEDSGFVRLLNEWLEMCQLRREQQRREAKLLGKKLVACIAKCVNARAAPRVHVTARHELEDTIFGERTLPLRAEQPSPPVSTSPPDVDASPAKQRYLDRTESRLVRSIRAEERGVVGACRSRRYRQRAVVSLPWLKRYRAFLRKDLVMPDGRLAAFRYRLPRDGVAGRGRADGVEEGSGGEGGRLEV